MATNDQKTPAGLSANRHARGIALQQIAKTGRSLPCVVTKVAGSIVTVSFQVTAAPGQTPPTIPNATMPIVGSEYIRIPVQVGMKGMAVAADAYLGGMSGLGGGVATLVQSANLTALAFVPLGNVSFFSVDGNVLVLYGPQGVTLQDQSGASKIMLTPTSITFAVAGQTITIDSSGITLNGIPWGSHVHGGVRAGGSNTGVPV